MYSVNLKNIFKIFLSLRTTIWLLISLIFLFLYGSVIMPLRQEFQTLYNEPLFLWLKKNPYGITWWLWGSIIIVSILTVNTVTCSIESLIKKRKSKQFLLVISPQLMHVGFLFILLAHLMSSYGSFKGMAIAYNDTVIKISERVDVLFKELNAVVDKKGFIKDCYADVEYFKDGRPILKERIRPNNPSMFEGMGIYIKTVQIAPFPVALVEISYEPGAIWALIGSILFLAGMIILLILKIRREEAEPTAGR